MDRVNPYHPPAAPTSDPAAVSPLRFLACLVPATIAVGLSLLLWVVLVSTLDGLLGHQFDMAIWSFTLILSSSLSILAIKSVWRSKTQPIAFGVAYGAFSIVFAFAEGDVSNGSDSWMAAIVYGTLLSLPLAMYLLARGTASDRLNPQRSPSGES